MFRRQRFNATEQRAILNLLGHLADNKELVMHGLRHETDFYVLLTVHLGIIFVNNQLDAQFFFMFVYFYSLHVSGSHVPIIRRIVSVRHLVYFTLYR
jgi:hypothetical protein